MQSRFPSVIKQTITLWHIQTTEYHLALKQMSYKASKDREEYYMLMVKLKKSIRKVCICMIPII